MGEPIANQDPSGGRRAQGCPVLDFDHHAVDSARRFEVWAELRNLAPVFWSERYGGFWVATSFEAVSAVLSDAATFSSAKQADGSGGQSIPPFLWQRNVPGEYDGEEHLRFRQVLLPALAPKAIEARRPTIRRIVGEIFDALDGRAEINAVREIAVPVPARSMFDFMGLPAADAGWIGLTVHEIMGARGANPQLEEALKAINQRMLDEVAARRAAPREDIVSHFANMQNDDRLLTPDELLSVLVTGFLFGGLVTAADVLANAIVYLDLDREVRAQLIAQPEQIPNFVQDVVRWVSPAPTVARTVTRETVLGGQTLRPGERILALIASANLDERAFECPERVDPTRWRNRHLGFGVGAHFCPGAPLARLEIELAVRELLARMPQFEIAERNHVARLAARDGGWVSLTLRPHPR